MKHIRRATSKPFLCREDGSAHKFTVLGDSHARAFDLAAMRVGNDMSVNRQLDDRARSTADLNAHLRAFCLDSSRAGATPRCRFVDLTPTLVPAGYPAGRVPAGGKQGAAQPVEGVLRPYLNLLAPDIHLRFDRIYGQALEGLRAALGANWCVDDAGGGG